jgi:small-conductance mechanosensitive channel
MDRTPLQELAFALAEGLRQPQHFWSAVVLGVALLAGWLGARLVHRRLDRRLENAAAEQGAGIDAWRFSIEGVRRLAFPLIVQGLLWAGEAALRIAGHLAGAGDERLLRLAMTLFGAMALIRLVVYVLRRALRNVAVLAASEWTIALFIWLIVALHATGALGDVIEWMESTTVPLGRTPVAVWVVVMAAVSVVVTLVLALWAGSLIESRLMGMQQLDSNLRVVLSRLARAALLVAAVLLALSSVGIDLTVLSVFGGALGVGLGLGLQRIASNYVSGFIILLERSLRIGDMIRVDQHSGRVTQINARYTVIRALDGTEAIVPNEMLVAQPVANFSYSDPRVALNVKVSVSYATDPRQAMALLAKAAAAQRRVLADPAPSAVLLGFGADGLDLQVNFWIADPHEGRANVQSDVALAMLDALRGAGIEIPYPQRDVRLVGALPPPAAAQVPAPPPGRPG